jgi:hypothetical protein
MKELRVMFWKDFVFENNGTHPQTAIAANFCFKMSASSFLNQKLAAIAVFRLNRWWEMCVFLDGHSSSIMT